MPQRSKNLGSRCTSERRQLLRMAAGAASGARYQGICDSAPYAPLRLVIRLLPRLVLRRRRLRRTLQGPTVLRHCPYSMLYLSAPDYTLDVRRCGKPSTGLSQNDCALCLRALCRRWAITAGGLCCNWYLAFLQLTCYMPHLPLVGVIGLSVIHQDLRRRTLTSFQPFVRPACSSELLAGARWRVCRRRIG